MEGDRDIQKRCIHCNLSKKKFIGKYKEIKTDEEVRKYQAVCENTVQIGSLFCNKCRLLVYQRRQVDESSIDDNNSDPSFYIHEKNTIETEYVDLPLKRVKITHIYCTLCNSTKNLVVVPFEARIQAFTQRGIFIPKENRCCQTHLIKKRFFHDELQLLREYSNYSSMDTKEIFQFLNIFAHNIDVSLYSQIGEYSLSEDKLKTFTGLNWESINMLKEMLTSMKNSEARTVTQALVVFLFKLRSGNSNNMIQKLFGLEREQQVSDYFHQVINAFEKDILPNHFGINAKSREDLIINETAYVAKNLFQIKETTLALIFDGTYVRHEKSNNNIYQRKSFSGQKKVPLCKPFTICTTNGYIVDIIGPFNANVNDAAIMKTILENPNGLRSIMQQGDMCFVDRGFRDAVENIENLGYNVLMPACKGNRKQLTTEEANHSRRVTKVRWVVEAVHGDIGQKYNLLHHKLDNKLLPVVGSLCRIAGFLHNMFGKRLNSDLELADTIIAYMRERETQKNTLQNLVEVEKLSRRKKPFTTLSSTSLIDFPELTENDLKILFTGTYQMSQAVGYLAELIDGDKNDINIEYFKENGNIIRMKVRSRHINSKTYQCFIEYEPNMNNYKGIKRYTCDCANGNRTIGCCSHVASIIYYLSHGRYKSKIIKPAEILTHLFDTTNVTTTIDENSDED